MQWIVALVCIFALMNGISDASESVSAPLLNTLLVLSGSFLVPALTAWQTASVIRRFNAQMLDKERLIQVQQLFHWLHVAIWIAFSVFITVVLQWGHVVRSEMEFYAIPLVDELLILIPVLFPLLAGWAILYDLERLSCADSAQEAVTIQLKQSRWQYVGIRSRWYLVMSVLPILIMWLARDIAMIPQSFMSQTAWGVGICSLFFVAKIALFPFLMAVIWDTRSIRDTHFGKRLYEIALNKKIGVWDIRMWMTGGQILNAVVTGIFPKCKMILLTDRLVDELDSEQIESVFRHEVTHAQRLHLPIRIAIVLLPVVGYFVANAMNPDGIERVLNIFANWGITVTWMQTVLLPTFYVAFLMAVLGWMSRTMEHDADIGACMRDGGSSADQSGDDCEREIVDKDAIKCFSNALLKISVTQNTSVTKKSWLHPSVMERYEFLRSIGIDPSMIARFRKRLDFQVRTLLGAMIAAVLAMMII
jgi:STE24 endopeptidase